MRTYLLTQNFKLIFLIPLAILVSFFNLQAQDEITLSVSPPDENEYTFEVNGVEEFDLIYFRFSDGYHMTKVVEEGNTHSSVTRQFKNIETYRAIAYVAKKNGTLDRATNIETVEIEDYCGSCILPTVNMSSDSNIGLSLSWNAFFTDGVEEIPTFIDNISSPLFPTPSNIPWFFVNLTLENSGLSMEGNYLDFHFPDNVFEVVGVILNGEWIEINSSQNSNYNSSSTLTPTISYNISPQANFVRFYLEEEIENQANFYIILKGEPTSEFDEYEFSAKLFNKKSKKFPIDVNALKVTPTQQPHDPNEIFSPLYAPCFDDEITYKVDFQNLGEGEAIDVDVKINVDESFLDINTLTAIESSHSITNYQIDNDIITFTFTGINLSGINQTNPTPSYNETKGWIKFQLSLNDCVVPDDNNPNLATTHLVTEGVIIFYGQGNFEQHTLLNKLAQKPCHIPCPSLGLNIENRSEVEILRTPSSGDSNQIPFSVNIYPSIVADFLTVESSILKPGVPLEINFVDIAGRVWETKNFSSIFKMNYKEEVDISHLPAGIYFLQVKHGQELFNQKIVKK